MLWCGGAPMTVWRFVSAAAAAADASACRFDAYSDCHRRLQESREIVDDHVTQEEAKDMEEEEGVVPSKVLPKSSALLNGIRVTRAWFPL